MHTAPEGSKILGYVIQNEENLSYLNEDKSWGRNEMEAKKFSSLNKAELVAMQMTGKNAVYVIAESEYGPMIFEAY